MATIKLIKEAIVALKDRTGSSVPAIKKWIETEKKVSNTDQERSERLLVNFFDIYSSTESEQLSEFSGPFPVCDGPIYPLGRH